MPRFSAQHRFPKQRNAVLNFPQTIKHFPLHCLEENNARVSIKLRNLHENTSIQHHIVSMAPKRYISCCNSQQRQYFLPQQNENFVLEECLWFLPQKTIKSRAVSNILWEAFARSRVILVVNQRKAVLFSTR